jgi:HD-GYP domain-containing protein (c-di-GMP phosphodiesterase class II)
MYNRFGVWQSSQSNETQEERPSVPPEQVTVVTDLTLQEMATFLSIPLETVPLDAPLPCSVYVRISEKFVLFRRKGDTITQSRATALAGPSNGVIFVRLDEWHKLLHSLEALAIAAQKAVSTQNPLHQGLQIRNLLLAYTREIERSKLFSSDNLNKILLLSAQFAALIYQTPSLSNQLLKRYQDPALYYVNHAVNVGIYSIAIGLKKGLPLSSGQSLAFASLVHNIGNIMIPAELLYKPTELTVQEKNTVDTHILHGATLLQSLKAPVEAVLTAMQHHDRFDGTGTSGRKAGNDIHLFARICSIADVFDAMISNRPHQQNALTPKEAVQRITEMKGKFDPGIISIVPKG